MYAKPKKQKIEEKKKKSGHENRLQKKRKELAASATSCQSILNFCGHPSSSSHSDVVLSPGTTEAVQTDDYPSPSAEPAQTVRRDSDGTLSPETVDPDDPASAESDGGPAVSPDAACDHSLGAVGGSRSSLAAVGTMLNTFPQPAVAVGAEDSPAPVNVCGSPSQSSQTATSPSACHFGSDPNDIGRYVGEKVDTETARRLLTSRWTPPATYTFPVTRQGGKNRRFQAQYLKNFSWLAYSAVKGGAFCVPCVLLARHETDRGSHQPVGVLVTKPMCRYKNATVELDYHQKTDYHKNAVAMAEGLLDGNRTIVEALQAQDAETASQLSSALQSVTKSVIFCGRLGLPLRGHRDVGRLDPKEDIRDGEGVMRGLLKLRVDAGDQQLRQFLEAAPGNALRISWETQNELINLCGQEIVEKIVSRVKDAGIFSVIVDETTDTSTQEQVALCVRYVDRADKYTVREDFVGIVAAAETTGSHLAHLIMTKLEAIGLSVDQVRGQGYDGASNMSGKFSGVQAEIKKIQPLATYTHCASHRLNLAIVQACKNKDVSQLMGLISNINSFLKNSAARTAKLQMYVEKLNPEMRRKRLKPLCLTRWIERHDTLVVFHDLLPAIVKTLECVSQSANATSEAASTARCLLLGIRSFKVVMTLAVCVHVFGVTLPLSKALQKESLTLEEGFSMVQSVKKDLHELRDEFQHVFEAAAELSDTLDVEVSMPRTCKLQTNRTNAPSDNALEHYRRNLFLPVIDAVTGELTCRFPDNYPGKDLMVIPSRLGEGKAVVSAAKAYEADLPSLTCLGSELVSWRVRWADVKDDEKPSSALEALNRCHPSTHPNVHALLKVLCTLPLTSCAAERTFSALKRVKTTGRSTMGEDRLEGLLLMEIHKTINIDTVSVVNKYLKKRNIQTRRLV